MGDTIIAIAILRSSDGKSVADTTQPITSEISGRIQIDEVRRQQTRERLEAHGVTIVSENPFSLSFSPDKTVFERIFKSQLRKVAPKPDPSISKPLYQIADAIEIPEDLAEHVAAVSIPSPPDLFE
jgi:hypothetical protein